MQFSQGIEVMDPAALQVQQLLQQQRGIVNGYMNFTQPGLMYRDMGYYNPALAGAEYVGYMPQQQPQPQPLQVEGREAPEAAVPSSSAEEGKPQAGGRGKKGADKSGSGTYASRHQAAESRRRQRINDRLDQLRKIVPHRERANTATFLEEVISYVNTLQKRIQELESQPHMQAPTQQLLTSIGLGQPSVSNYHLPPMAIKPPQQQQQQQQQLHQHTLQQQQQQQYPVMHLVQHALSHEAGREMLLHDGGQRDALGEDEKADQHMYDKLKPGTGIPVSGQMFTGLPQLTGSERHHDNSLPSIPSAGHVLEHMPDVMNGFASHDPNMPAHGHHQQSLAHTLDILAGVAHAQKPDPYGNPSSPSQGERKRLRGDGPDQD